MSAKYPATLLFDVAETVRRKAILDAAARLGLRVGFGSVGFGFSITVPTAEIAYHFGAQSVINFGSEIFRDEDRPQTLRG
jgi:hypothetical protein